jgi:RNA polymerase sigma-70 factor (ECF subfamily)
MMEPCSDEELLQRIAQQDRSAMTELYDRYERVVFGFALRTVSDRGQAEEVVQDVFMRIWRNAQRYDPQLAKVSTWMLTVTRRCAIDALRKSARRPSSDLTQDEQLNLVPATEPGPEAQASAVAVRDIVAAALQSLPRDQRVALERMYYQGYTQSEIAQEFGIPLGTVKGRIRLGLARLREQLDAAGLRDIQ